MPKGMIWETVAGYDSYNKPLCEENAKAEGVTNTSFAKDDALKLDFADETFNAVYSNYVYHNIPCRYRQKILTETLRELRKGSTYAILDIFPLQKVQRLACFCATAEKKKNGLRGGESAQRSVFPTDTI